MNNIGIVTFHRADSCGAILQTFALQNKIIELGSNPIIIDYYNFYDLKRTKLFHNGDKKSNIIKNIYRILKKRKFDKFIKKYIFITKKKYKNKDELKKLDDTNYFVSYIVGSDQVWNPGITNYDDTYLLSFVCNNHLKNSYAASFGSANLSYEQIKIFDNNLSTFNCVTIRERTSLIKYPFLKKYGTDTALDPTLLLSKDDYLKIKRKQLYRNYAFLYVVGNDVKLRKYAQDICEKRGLKLIDCKKSIEFFIHSSPEDFLSLIEFADIVFTNSFHGTVFSIIFEKKFVTEVNLKNGFNSRSDDLLNLLHIHYRDIDDSNFDIDAYVDWNNVNSIKKDEVDKSIRLLRRMI